MYYCIFWVRAGGVFTRTAGIKGAASRRALSRFSPALDIPENIGLIFSRERRALLAARAREYFVITETRSLVRAHGVRTLYRDINITNKQMIGAVRTIYYLILAHVYVCISARACGKAKNRNN